MCKRVIIGLFALSLVALVSTDANAGCCCNPLRCASYITGSGMPTGLVTGDAKGDDGFVPVAPACTVATTQGSGEEEIVPDDLGIIIQQLPTPATSLTMRLVGTVGENCGLGPDDNALCDIRGVAVCGASVSMKEETPGPLTVFSPGFGQTDESTNSANFRFQLDPFQQAALCPDDTFVAFFAREGFFETCVNPLFVGDPANCIQEFCRVDVGGIQRDAPRVYTCQPV